MSLQSNLVLEVSCGGFRNKEAQTQMLANIADVICNAPLHPYDVIINSITGDNDRNPRAVAALFSPLANANFLSKNTTKYAHPV